MFLAALLAFVVANFLAAVMLVTFVAGIGALLAGSSTTTLSEHSVLYIDLEQPIVDEPSGALLSDMDMALLRLNRKLSLLDVLGAIDQAAEDSRIDGILLNISPAHEVGLASMGEIRAALERFKASGKFLVSYADFYSQKSYYLSSVADEVYLNPEGQVLWKGLSAQVMFYKGLLDKLDLKPEVIRHGAFKSAVEPFILEKMSPENRLQMTTLTGTIWGQLLGEIAASRPVDSAALQQYASELALSGAAEALRLGMVDSLAYRADVEEMLEGMTDEEYPEYVSLGEYVSLYKTSQKNYSKNHLAVVYAEGEIVDGSGGREMVGGDDLAAKLADMRRDDDVKAVVLRVNSPGGSALAAEVIWHEMELLRQEKPLIVSMGDVAASGGYYIAAPADAILASPSTLTGSIGVFGLLLDASEGLRNKLGITTDVAKTNPSADLGSPFRPMTGAERAYMQQGVERVYATFVGHVAAGRNLSIDRVDEIGQGRVWSGVSALDNGLIDSYGGLREAISLAADRAGLGTDFQLVSPSVPTPKLNLLLDALSARISAGKAPPLEGDLAAAAAEYARLQRILSRTGVQALMPGSIRLE